MMEKIVIFNKSKTHPKQEIQIVLVFDEIILK